MIQVIKDDNFSIVPIEQSGEFLWCIFEHATDQVIHSFYFEDDAKKYVKFLKSGGAFNGYTPAFILTEFSTQPVDDIDEVFNLEFQ